MAGKIATLYPFSGRWVSPCWAVGITSVVVPIGITHYTLLSIAQPRHENRIKLVEMALDAGCDYVFFVDDDTIPPKDALLHLFTAMENADDDVMAVGGIYTTRLAPEQPICFLSEHTGPHWKWKVGEIFPCHTLGAGCLLIKAEAFKRIEKPWFHEDRGIKENGVEFSYTDDSYFCKKLAGAGLKVLAHGGVLPIHISQDGRMHVMPDTSYPLRDIDAGKLWYAPLVRAVNQLPRRKA